MSGRTDAMGWTWIQGSMDVDTDGSMDRSLPPSINPSIIWEIYDSDKVLRGVYFELGWNLYVVYGDADKNTLIIKGGAAIAPNQTREGFVRVTDPARAAAELRAYLGYEKIME